MNENNEIKNFIVKIEDGIAIFTLNKPEKRNALSNDCHVELSKLIDFVEEREDIKVIIITGAGEKAFIAGADINALKIRTGVDNLKSVSRISMQKMENCSKPIIAAINGVAFGGGFELALACDIRIASENAKFALPETGLGILPGAGGTQKLARMAGVGVAKELIMAGRVLTAQEAVNYGIAMKVVPLSDLMNEAVKVAKTMMEKGPLALNVVKKILNASMFTDTNTGLILENFGIGILLNSDDKLEGTSAFLEKRKPVYKGK